MASWIVAAEWVGVLSSHDAGGHSLRFAPGGLAHAFDRDTGTVVCGVDARSLELFEIDFVQDEWSMRCEACMYAVDSERRGTGVRLHLPRR
jgi:hypothetical protein